MDLAHEVGPIQPVIGVGLEYDFQTLEKLGLIGLMHKSPWPSTTCHRSWFGVSP